MKKAIALLLILCIFVPTAGCWNYRGLNELTIVAGVAIDKVENQYLLTFEIMDLTKPVKTEGVTSRVIQSQGQSVFDAIRNAKKQLSSRLYFGNVQVVIISQEIVRDDGLHSVLDFFLRDPEMRETIRVVVPQEHQAWELLNVDQKDGTAVSYGIVQILRDNSKLVGATIDKPLYLIYRELYTPGSGLVLPAFHVGSSGTLNPSFAEANGAAVFKGDHFAGFISTSETKYLLLARNELQGGILVLYMPEVAPHNISLEIIDSSSTLSHQYVDGKLTIKIEISVNAFLGEFPHKKMRETQLAMDPITAGAEQVIRKNVLELIKNSQTKYNSDIFGFGNSIYRRDLALWDTIEEDWEEIYPGLTVEVVPKVHLLNSAMLYQK